MKNVKIVYPRKNIEVIYAGGTISSLATSAGYREGGHAVDLVGLLIQKYPDMKGRFVLGKTVIAYTGLSENMDEGHWIDIEKAVRKVIGTNTKAVIITHGTDSMEQTARRLKSTFENELVENGIKIILTGANDDISASDTDAWDNLLFAFESADSSKKPGVYVAFHQKLIPAELVVKEPFNGHKMNFVSKSDPEYVVSIKVQKNKEEELVDKLRQSVGSVSAADSVMEYDVNVVRNGHDEFISRVIEENIRAVILILYHSGTANTEKPELSVSHLVNRLRVEKGIVFFGVTENGEPVNLHSYETSVRLREAGVVPLYNIERRVALAKLQLVVSGTNAHIIDEMLDNKVGEIDESQIIVEDIDRLKKLY